ncbi:MAG: aminodeoxychorismate synthase component I [Bacteroidales bacterium]
MENYTKKEAIEIMNRLGKEQVPFLFIIDYAMEQNRIIPLAEVNTEYILFDFSGRTNVATGQTDSKNVSIQFPTPLIWEKYPVSPEQYRKGFDIVINGLKSGNSFLTNLTGRTPLRTNLSLLQIFSASQAKYKLWVKDEFCSLSPEIFVQIKEGRIASYPMKGTIDASVPDAETRILNDPKEQAEHATIVDLIRNDLSIHARRVDVARYRYIDRLKTNTGELLQVSSEVCGELPCDYREKLGTIIYDMLPAGSICGAPKKKTCEIIAEAEGTGRGFYTGIAGIFDGNNLDSGVLIRFVEQGKNGDLFFRSGGGITAKSNCQSEYEELIQKIYVPICRDHQNM